MKNTTLALILISVFLWVSCTTQKRNHMAKTDKKVNELIAQMTLEEKIGQLVQKNGDSFSDSLVRSGGLGSVLNLVNVDEINRIQAIAVEESRLGIPILFARDVIHGFKTIMPIPLGQAASWNPQLIRKGAEIASIEARSSGIRWTFAPMIDVTRDPRWGRIAESFGEDPYLTSVLAKASVEGYQGDNLAHKNALVACAKHLAAYGAAEAGRDYHTVTLPENELRDVYLPPFKAAVDAQAGTFMNAFNEINGIPATGHELLLRQILRGEWSYDGMVVSDWSSVQQMVVHGYATDEKDAALKAIQANPSRRVEL
jgi:beta-glucosidase